MVRVFYGCEHRVNKQRLSPYFTGSMTKRTLAVTAIAALLILISVSAVALEYKESHDLDLTYPCDMTLGGGSGSVEYSGGVREIYNSAATLSILFS